MKPKQEGSTCDHTRWCLVAQRLACPVSTAPGGSSSGCPFLVRLVRERYGLPDPAAPKPARLHQSTFFLCHWMLRDATVLRHCYARSVACGIALVQCAHDLIVAGI